MSSRLRGVGLLAAAGAAACLVVAASAAAGTEQFSGTVPNGGCDSGRIVAVSGPSRIEINTSSTAQNNTQVFAEIVAPNGRTVAGGSAAAYDTPGGGSYAVRVCANYQEQSPPNLQYTALVGTGPAGQPVLVGPTQPQPPTGGVLGATTTIGYLVTGKVAIRTHAGLAWFTIRTASNGRQTLRFYDPTHLKTRTVTGLEATVSGTSVRLTGHGLRLVLVHSGGRGRAAFVSSSFSARGAIVRGRFQVKL